MLFMVIEKYRNGDPVPVYQRLRDRGRSIPTGIAYRGSWVTSDLGRCYQIMECHERSALDSWIASWADLVEFEVVPVMTSDDAQAAVAGRLG